MANSGGLKAVRESSCSGPPKKTAGIHAEAALPARKGMKSFFFGAHGGLCASFLDGTDPRRAATPKNAGRPLARTAQASPHVVGLPVSFAKARMELTFSLPRKSKKVGNPLTENRPIPIRRLS